MSHVLRFAGLGVDVPQRVREVVNEIERLRPRLNATIAPNGGIAVAQLDVVLAPALRDLGFGGGSDATIAAKELHYTDYSRWTALSIQAGRAFTNNGALLAVLAATSTHDVDWLVLLVPDRYKNSNTYEAVIRQLGDLEASPGVRLDLEGAVVIEY